MLKRKAYEKLQEWKNTENRKALCISGARQIGKTTLIRQFGKENYRYFVELNFLADKKASAIFSDALDAETVITALTAYVRKPMVPGETLVFFDEIQACPEARTAIKFLVEDGRFDYVESGSLLGIMTKEVRSYPVGFEDLYRMYPMDLEEFFWALGVQPSTIEYLRNCCQNCLPVQDSVHETMKKLFYNYIVVGGMPEVVQLFADTHDIGRVTALQQSLLLQYRQDISKYADSSETMKIKDIFDAIPSQLNEKNRRFYVNSINANARINRYANSFRWLDDAGVALPCYNVTEPQTPLTLNSRHSLFKLYMNDTGLLCAASMGNIQFDLLNGNLEINMGSVLENVIAQQLKTNGYDLFYFDSTRHGEVDFVLETGPFTELIEVKSGRDYLKHTALDNVMQVADWKFRRATVLCSGNLQKTEDLLYLPWYMAIFLKPEKTQKESYFKVDLSALQNL